MDELNDKIGTVVKNDGKGLIEALGVNNLEHTGNYNFEASFGGMRVAIATEPQDDEGEFIKITNIKIHPNAVRKVGIAYKMLRGNETAETFINLPISPKRYEELISGIRETNNALREVRDALVQLTHLQGYDELGAWSLELTIE